MRITKKLIEKMNPCKNRFENFTSNYPDYDDELSNFLALENITYSDKVWVCTRLLTRNQLVHWSIMCAESVKQIFEARYPENKAVSNLLTFMKGVEDFENMTGPQRDELSRLRGAAYAAYAADAAAAYAAYAAYAAAAYAADAADAAYAAYAAAAYAADAADADAAAAYAAYAAAKEEQRNLNLLYLASFLY
jgi:hypothetical protein